MAKQKQEKSNNWSNYSSTVSAVKSGKITGLYLISGEEKYAIDRLIAFLKSQLVDKNSEALDYYQKDCTNSELSIDEFKSLVGSPPFLSRKRVTVIRNSGWWGARAPSTTKEQDAMKNALTDMPEYACAIFVEDKVDNRKKQLIEAVRENGTLVEISFFSEEQLTKMITDKLGKHGITLPWDSMTSLISRTDSSMRLIDNELTKIILYCTNTKTRKVDLTLLNQLSVPDVHASVFDMTDAIGQRNVGKALEILNDLVLLKEPIPKIRLMLSRHFRQLISVKDAGNGADIASTMKLHPFVAKKLVSQARGFQLDQLEKLYDLCFETDLMVKNGKMEDRMAMEYLLASSVL